MSIIQAYKRDNGKIGIRNYILVISTVSCVNTVTSKIAQKTGAIPINHEQGCVEFEDDHKRTVLALSSAGRNPNVAGVLVVGLGCEQTSSQPLIRSIQASGKPVEFVRVQDEGGSPEAIQKGVELIEKLQKQSEELAREECTLEGLVVGVQCGGSDWTTAISGNTVIGKMTDLVIQNGGSVLMSEVAGFPGSEHIVAEQAVSHQVGLDVFQMVDELRADFVKDHGQTIEKINPTPGNKAGGITTLVEKSMGNIKKMGSSPVQGLLKLEDKIPYPGLWIVDSRVQGPDQFSTTGFGILGAHVTVFSTGRGTPIGNAVMPLIKITGNPVTYTKFQSILDFNAGVVLEGESIEETGKSLYEFLLKVANGKQTKSEINENFEFVIPREQRRKAI
ncbi:UxaA family hydrolase [Cytobacillus firmus]|uniref:UxaA family hydrolase n=1 Tax=Cytobacillus firmus TaxID=1399 RepID=UPI0018CCD3A5|nr:UxaA family hydrolase [Cytobacillus firmus]MBG9444405.1 D-galactarate dehydratase [Cytobacillus firmus]URT71707.1 UxaA family hydrolase [Cytobacillus firmus]